MKPALDPSALGKTTAGEYLIRFVLGGVVTACTGLVAHAYGPGIGGLFLAFPAILPASLTLVKEHAGRREAVEDARGARLGTLGLATFALVVSLASAAWPPAGVLIVAAVGWSVTCALSWTLVYGRRP